MHSFHFPDERRVPRSKLGATLLRLHRNLEGSRQREQAALELFESWQSRWSDHRDVIARSLECLDQELAQLTSPALPGPHLSLLATGDVPDDDDASAGGANSEIISDQDAEDAPTHLRHNLWHNE